MGLGGNLMNWTKTSQLNLEKYMVMCFSLIIPSLTLKASVQHPTEFLDKSKSVFSKNIYIFINTDYF